MGAVQIGHFSSPLTQAVKGMGKLVCSCPNRSVPSSESTATDSFTPCCFFGVIRMDELVSEPLPGADRGTAV